MLIRSRFVAFAVISSFAFLLSAADPAQDRPITRVLFGSCINQDDPTPILETMVADRPDLVLLTGDNIYADTEDMQMMRRKYRTLAENRAFSSLRNTSPLLATWDDHDFGVNDGGADYLKRIESQQAFLDFFQVPSDSPRREQAGVYDARTFGPKGKRLQVIMLDTRYFRSPLKKGNKRVGGPYYPDNDARKTMLGESQWRWLERQLRQPADVRLVVSSIQFVASDSGQECWANLPRERERMLQLIQATNAEGVLFISGDRHWSEISAFTSQTSYPIYDVTCSSLNQLHPRGTPTENEFRVNPSTFHRENYGVMEINWDEEDPTIAISIRDLEGVSKINQKISRRDLSF